MGHEILPHLPDAMGHVLRPGATRTSRLMAAYIRPLRKLQLWEDERQKKEAQTKNLAAMEAVADDIDGEGQPSKKPKHSAPAPMHMGFSSGSVDGVVQRVFEPQNISRAAAFLSEGLIFHSRLSDQCPSNEGLATQLTGRILWDKVTVKAWMYFEDIFVEPHDSFDNGRYFSCCCLL